MSKVLVTESYLTDIGNAIRAKNGGTTKYKPSEMAEAIKSLTTGGGGASLPSGITKLDSVSLSKQYIDTGITPEPNYTYQIDFSTTNSPSAACAIFGCRESGRNSRCFCLTQLTTKGNVRFDFDYIPPDASTYQEYVSYIGDGLQTHTYFDGQEGTIWFSNESHGDAYTKLAIDPSSISKLTASIYLGACHQQNSNSAILATNSIKFYSCKIINIFGNKTICEFIPASYNGKKGMYEIVNSRFHGVDGTITSLWHEQ